jgi:hypothetical protein
VAIAVVLTRRLASIVLRDPSGRADVCGGRGRAHRRRPGVHLDARPTGGASRSADRAALNDVSPFERVEQHRAAPRHQHQTPEPLVSQPNSLDENARTHRLRRAGKTAAQIGDSS